MMSFALQKNKSFCVYFSFGYTLFLMGLWFRIFFGQTGGMGSMGVWFLPWVFLTGLFALSSLRIGKSRRNIFPFLSFILFLGVQILYFLLCMMLHPLLFPIFIPVVFICIFFIKFLIINRKATPEERNLLPQVKTPLFFKLLWAHIYFTFGYLYPSLDIGFGTGIKPFWELAIILIYTCVAIFIPIYLNQIINRIIKGTETAEKSFPQKISKIICIVMTLIIMLFTFFFLSGILYWDTPILLYPPIHLDQPEFLLLSFVGIPLCLALCLIKEPKKQWQTVGVIFCFLLFFLPITWVHFKWLIHPGVASPFLVLDQLVLLSFLGYLFLNPYKEISK